MAYNLTEQTKIAASATTKTPNLIVDIEGYDVLFGYFQDLKEFRFDEGYEFDTGLFFDTLVPNNKTLPFVSQKGTTKRLTQQLKQDGGTGSISNMKVSLIDYRGQVTELFGSDELLGVKANIYLSFQGLQHPRDSIRIFSGIISGVETPPGEWVFTIDNPDTLKRRELFIQYSDVLTSAITDTDTTIPVRNTNGFIGSQAVM